MKKIFILLFSISIVLISCNKNSNAISTENKVEETTSSQIESKTINVNFALGERVVYPAEIKESATELAELKRTHSVKYYSYMPSPESTIGNFTYYDVTGNKRIMTINEKVKKNTYKWESEEGVFSKMPPIGRKMSYGIDISKHNGDIDFNKVRDAGFEFVFVRIVYRGYGKKGSLNIDEMQEKNLKLARNAGLKVGAYVFSQSINEEEAVEEAKMAVDLIKDYGLDLPIVFDPETIRDSVARTDNVEGEQFTKNAIAFCEEIKKAGFTPAIYSNMVWEDYYLDLEKLSDYDIWYADYNKLPQTPYDFKYWQFSEVGIVDGVEGQIDLNVMIE